jgi:hypothetical protein
MSTRLRYGLTLLLLAVGSSAALPTASLGATALYGSSVHGDLFVVDLVTGAGFRIATLPDETTEIECDPAASALAPICYFQLPDGAFEIQRFDLNTGNAIGGTVADGFSFTGLEFVGGVLFGTAISAPNGPSSLRTLNPITGTSVLIGATAVGPISGLAFDVGMSVMYGIAGGPGLANLYTIDLATGLATLVGNTGIHAGSLQFGPDGKLYAGTTGPNGGDIYRIDPATGGSTLVGSTGFDSVTGLTLAAREVGAPAPVLSQAGLILATLSLILIAVYGLTRRRTGSPSRLPSP